MAISHNINNNIIFSTELDIIHISGVNDASLRVMISNNGVTVFAADYIPGNNGDIVIYNIKRLVEAYIEDVFSDFTFTFGEESIDVRVFKTAIRISESAEEFLPSFFLTILMTSKKTSLARYETLSFYPQESCNVYADVSYYANETVTTYTVELLPADSVTMDSVNMVDVSPKQFIDESKGAIVSIAIHAGQRLFTLEVDDTLPLAEPALLFRNNFDCWETIYLTGIQETEYDIKRSQAYIDGMYKQYDIEDTELFKANSGVLLGNMLRLGMDLGRATTIFLLDSHGNTGDAVVLTESEIKYSNDDNVLPTFEYTYRRCTPVTALLKIARPVKLFDDTFDTTFN